MYTPYTPGDSIHRFSVDGISYVCEVNGDLNSRMINVISDLNFIFGSGWSVSKITKDLKGHLLPMTEKIDWPGNIAPLARFAQWNPRGTVDKILDDAKILVEKWIN